MAEERMEREAAGETGAAMQEEICPECGGRMIPWIADKIDFSRRPPEGEKVPHDHLWKCPQCGYETLERSAD